MTLKQATTLKRLSRHEYDAAMAQRAEIVDAKIAKFAAFALAVIFISQIVAKIIERVPA